MQQNELYHHGIKGMKWGVRRFQTPDGSLTAAGKKRYADGNSGTINGSIPKLRGVTSGPIKGDTPKLRGVTSGPIKGDTPKLRGVTSGPITGSKKRTSADAEESGIQKMKNKISSAGKKAADTMSQKVKDIGSTEMGKRGKAALDVLKNGDSDWMGNHSYSDNVFTEAKNRGKAAIERLMYSEEQIDNKKFFGRYDF